MKFPLFNLSPHRWVDESIIDLALFNEFIYTDDNNYFDNYLKNNKFCDCKGTIYIVKSKITPSESWRKFFRFIPGIYKVSLQFENTGESISFQEFKTFFLAKHGIIKHKDILSEYWIDLVKKSESFEDLTND